jgi:hypothetical protein
LLGKAPFQPGKDVTSSPAIADNTGVDKAATASSRTAAERVIFLVLRSTLANAANFQQQCISTPVVVSVSHEENTLLLYNVGAV